MYTFFWRTLYIYIYINTHISHRTCTFISSETYLVSSPVYTRDTFQGSNRPQHKAKYSSLSTAEIKNPRSYTSPLLIRPCVVRRVYIFYTAMNIYFLQYCYFIIRNSSLDSSVGIVTMLPAQWPRNRGSISRWITGTQFSTKHSDSSSVPFNSYWQPIPWGQIGWGFCI